MQQGRIFTPFFDLKEHSEGRCGFFFLEHILKARVDLHCESTEYSDQELNIYIASLLNSLLFDGGHLQQKPYISPFDQDIRAYVSNHPGLRTTYIVYRENADAGLLHNGFFDGYTHDGSYHKNVMSHHDDAGRIALYYEIAASALSHLRGNNYSLVDVLETLSERIEMILEIIHYAATTYFDMMERLTEGSMFHLEREIDDLEKQAVYEKKLDGFLMAYSVYTENPTEAGKAELLSLAQELRNFKNDFHIEL